MNYSTIAHDDKFVDPTKLSYGIRYTDTPVLFPDETNVSDVLKKFNINYPFYAINCYMRTLGLIDIGDKKKRKTPPIDILKTLCIINGEDINVVSSNSRKGEIIKIKKLYCYFGRLLTGSSYDDLGLLVGLDHATVIHHNKDVQRIMSVDKTFKAEVNSISRKLNEIIFSK